MELRPSWKIEMHILPRDSALPVTKRQPNAYSFQILTFDYNNGKTTSNAITKITRRNHWTHSDNGPVIEPKVQELNET